MEEAPSSSSSQAESEEEEEGDEGDEPQQTDETPQGGAKQEETPSDGAKQEETPSDGAKQEETAREDAEKQMTKRKTGARNPPVHRVSPCTDLVLQMFSHMRTQRKLQQEKRSKIARAERRRQKYKKEAGSNSCAFSDSASMNTFGGYWTQTRLKHTIVRPESQGVTANNISNDRRASLVAGRSSPVNGASNDQSPDRGETTTNSPDHTARTLSPRVGGSKLNEKKYNAFTADSTRQSNTEIHIPAQEPAGPYTSPRFQKHYPKHQEHTQMNRSTHSIVNSYANPFLRNVTSAASNRSNTTSKGGQGGGPLPAGKSTYHVFKGPGRLQVGPSPSPVTQLRPARYPGRTHSYRWDVMPPGTLSTRQLRMVTIDGGVV